MKPILTENTLSQLSEFIASNLALNFPRDRWVDLERNIRIAATEFGYTDIEEFIQHIIKSPLTHERMEILAASLTIGETYFWREPHTFEALEKVIIPEIVHHRLNGEKRIRIWSAGCSTGEEPYSIAIALRETIPFIKDWNISILATDINTRNLRKATAGEYGKWSFRGTPPWLKEKYFVQKPNGRFEITPEIKSMVKFEYLNLAEDIYPSSLNDTNAMEVIYCRNVLMYFSQERFRQVARGFYKSLVQGGYLLVSASELSLQNFPDFTPVNVQGMVLYKKTSEKIKNLRQVSTTESSPEPSLLEFILEPETNSESAKYQPQLVESEILKSVDIPTPIDTNYEKSLEYYLQGRYKDAVETL
ncbi:MAG TPA: protein-glutamate O-methyltransferase CheR, partial [Williamwhitmania sp.]|nr:protein-glutamate O-methyltransferase CheR [Williamwhitmania sp.]